MIFRAYGSVSTLFLRCFLLNTGRSLSLWGCTACEAVRVLVNASFPGVIRRRKEELDTQAHFCTRVCIFYHNYVSPHGSRCSCLLLLSRRWRSSVFAASRILRTFAAASSVCISCNLLVALKTVKIHPSCQESVIGQALFLPRRLSPARSAGRSGQRLSSTYRG